MREIKFRVWDIANKCFIDDARDLVMGTRPHLQDYCCGEVESNYYNIVLMQFIGLKDKNNKEIYEGDIIGSPYHHNLEVFWHKDGYWSWFQMGYHLSEIIGNIYEHPELLIEDCE